MILKSEALAFLFSCFLVLFLDDYYAYLPSFVRVSPWCTITSAFFITKHPEKVDSIVLVILLMKNWIGLYVLQYGGLFTSFLGYLRNQIAIIEHAAVSIQNAWQWSIVVHESSNCAPVKTIGLVSCVRTDCMLLKLDNKLIWWRRRINTNHHIFHVRWAIH